jgi:hypothetical protein
MSFAHSRPRRLAAALAAGVLLTAGSALRSDASPAQEIALERTPSGHLLLPVTIDGDGPFPFILDTGASHTAIAAPVAERFGYTSQWTQVDDVQALTTRFEAERFALEGLQFDGQAPIDLVSVIIPVEEGQPIPVAGLLGADAIRAERYGIDLSLGRLTFNPAPLQHADGEIDPAGLLVGGANMMRTVRPVRVMLDSGSARTIANVPLERLIGNRHMVMRSMTIGGIDGRDIEEASLLSIRQFRLGGLCFPALRVLQSDLDIFRHLGWEDEPAMVIGMDLLQYARVSVDRPSGTFQIEAAVPDYACDRDG